MPVELMLGALRTTIKPPASGSIVRAKILILNQMRPIEVVVESEQQDPTHADDCAFR